MKIGKETIVHKGNCYEIIFVTDYTNDQKKDCETLCSHYKNEFEDPGFRLIYNYKDDSLCLCWKPENKIGKGLPKEDKEFIKKINQKAVEIKLKYEAM